MAKLMRWPSIPSIAERVPHVLAHAPVRFKCSAATRHRETRPLGFLRSTCTRLAARAHQIHSPEGLARMSRTRFTTEQEKGRESPFFLHGKHGNYRSDNIQKE